MVGAPPGPSKVHVMHAQSPLVSLLGLRSPAGKTRLVEVRHGVRRSCKGPPHTNWGESGPKHASHKDKSVNARANSNIAFLSGQRLLAKYTVKRTLITTNTKIRVSVLDPVPTLRSYL